MSDVILCRAQDPLPASKYWRGAFQHHFFMLSNSGLLTNTLTWKFWKPFSALDWNISVLFFFKWKTTIERYLFKWGFKSFSQGTEIICVANEEGGLILAELGGGLWFGQVSGKTAKSTLRRELSPASTCGTSIFQVITWPPHFSKWV